MVPHHAVESFNPVDLGDEIFRTGKCVSDVLKEFPENI